MTSGVHILLVKTKSKGKALPAQDWEDLMVSGSCGNQL